MTWYGNGPHAGETRPLAQLAPGECADGSGAWIPFTDASGRLVMICPSDPRYQALVTGQPVLGLGATGSGSGGKLLLIGALAVAGYFGWKLWKAERPEEKKREQLSVQRGADDAAYEDAQDGAAARPRFWFDVWGPRYGWEPDEWPEFKRLYGRNLKSYQAEIAAEAAA